MFHNEQDMAIDDVVRNLLHRCRIESAPVDAIELCDILEIDVQVDAAQVERGRLTSDSAGEPVIMIADDERPERVQFAVAHELGERFAHDIDPDANGAIRERIANRFAGRLLVPADWFRMDCRDYDWHLTALKAELYTTVSHELLAFRMLDISEATAITCVDHGEVTWRRQTECSLPDRLLPLERDVWQGVHESGVDDAANSSGVRVQVWAVHEPGWKREFIRTTVDELCQTADDAAAEFDDFSQLTEWDD